MKTIRLSWAAAAAFALAPMLVADRAAAQVFADALTTQAAGDDTPLQRLYQSAGVLAPVGSHIWFVADTLRNGIGTGATYDPGTSTLTLGPDDTVLVKDRLPGQVVAPISGLFQRNNIAYDVQYSDDAIYTLVFNTTESESNWGLFAGTSNLKFGIGQVVVTPPPGIGNARWDITQDIVASDNIVTVVPEPAAYGVIATLALAGVVAARKLARRA